MRPRPHSVFQAHKPMPFGILATFAAYFLWGLFPFYFHALQGIGALEILAHRIIWSLVFTHKHHADPVHFIAIRMVIAVIIQIQIFFTAYIVYLSSSIYPLYLSGSGIHAFISFQSFPLSKQCPTISMLFSSVHTLFPSVTIISSPSSGIGQSR